MECSSKDTYIIIPPEITASNGERFSVCPTNTPGVFRTYRGKLNFGWGRTHYAAYTFSEDGKEIYYSDSRTDFLLSLPLPGEYKIYITAEKPYTASNGKEINGFSETFAKLPEGAVSWQDDCHGVMSAVFSDKAEKSSSDAVCAEQNDKIEIISYEDKPLRYIKGNESSDEKEYSQGLVEYYTVGGTRVREIHINPVSDREKAAIAVFADTHLNCMNGQDMLDAEMSYTEKVRYWCRGGASVERMEHAAAFAKGFDGAVVAGDILDYLTYGTIGIVKEKLFSVLPDAIYTIGGHDRTKNMESGFPDVFPRKARDGILAENWTGDIYYESKLICESVLCIGLDNSGRYFPQQTEKLKTDIALARKNGYTVIIFEHEPIATGFERDAKNACLDSDAAEVKKIFDFYGPAHIGGVGRPQDKATSEVYSIITNNADVVRAVVCGHRHYNYYMEIKAKTPDGTDAVIPQYVIRANAYEKYGSIAKLVIG